MRYRFPEPVDAHDQDLTWLPHDRGKERRLSGEQVEVAEEAARAVHPDDPLLGLPVPVDQRDGPGEYDEEIAALVASR